MLAIKATAAGALIGGGAFQLGGWAGVAIALGIALAFDVLMSTLERRA